MFAYGTTADSVDEYLRIGETTTLKCVDKFVKGCNKCIRATIFAKANH